MPGCRRTCYLLPRPPSCRPERRSLKSPFVEGLWRLFLTSAGAISGQSLRPSPPPAHSGSATVWRPPPSHRLDQSFSPLRPILSKQLTPLINTTNYSIFGFGGPTLSPVEPPIAVHVSEQRLCFHNCPSDHSDITFFHIFFRGGVCLVMHVYVHVHVHVNVHVLMHAHVQCLKSIFFFKINQVNMIFLFVSFFPNSM